MKGLKILLVLVFVIGFGLVVAAFTMGLDFDEITNYLNDDEAYGEEIIYDTTEVIDAFDIKVDTRHIVFEKHTGTNIRIRYHAHEDKDTWTITEENGILSIEQDEKTQWLILWPKLTTRSLKTLYIALPDGISFDFDIQTGTGDVSLEMEQVESHGDILLNSGTGDVNIENVDVNELDVSLSTGNVSLVNVNIDSNLIANSNTGNIHLSSVTALSVELDSNTGEINIDGLTASSLSANCDTGSITIEETAISGDIILDSSTGSIEIQSTTADGFDISSSTGDVSVSVGTLALYRLDLKTDVGVVKVDGVNQGTTHITTTGSILIKVRVSTGTISIKA
jgi:hypothetical protein